jgi:hypothetical protein
VHGREHLFTHSFFLPPRWRSNCSFRTPSPVSVRIQKMTSITSSVQLIEALGGWDTTQLPSDKAVARKEECKDHRDSHCLVESVPRDGRYTAPSISIQRSAQSYVTVCCSVGRAFFKHTNRSMNSTGSPIAVLTYPRSYFSAVVRLVAAVVNWFTALVAGSEAPSACRDPTL